MKKIVLRILSDNGKIGSVVHVFLLRSLALVVNVCTSLLTAALLGPAGRGEQAALVIAPQFLAGMSTLGLNAALIYNVNADPEREREYLGAALLIALAAGSMAAGIGWVLEPVWLTKYSQHAVAMGRLFLFLTPLTSLIWVFNAMLESRARFVVANLAVCSAGFVTLIVLLVLAKEGLLTSVSAAGAYLLPSIPICAFLAVYVCRLICPKLAFKLAISRRLLHYGLRFYGIDFLSTLGAYIDQIILISLLTPHAVGIYVLAFSFSRLLNVIQTAVSTVLFPSIAAGHISRIIEPVALAVRITVVINAAAAVVFGLVGPYLLVLMYGLQFAPATAPFQVLLAETIVSNAARILYHLYNGSGHPGVVSAVEGIGLSVSIPSMLIMVPTYGPTGAAFAVLLGSSVRLATVLVALPVILRVRIPRLVLGRSDIVWLASRW